jgi:hypothetical protein
MNMEQSARDAMLGAIPQLRAKAALSRPWPVVIYMEFTSHGRISPMTIAVVDLQPLTNAILSAAQTGALKAA